MKLLLLVQTQSDADALPEATKSILAAGYTGVWVVFSPAITIDQNAAAAKFDSEISQLRDAEQQSATRGDYDAAKGYKGQREGKELDRAKALRDAWKTASEEDRKNRTQSIFQPFVQALNGNGESAKIAVKVTGHSDHYDREQWVQMLNSLSGAWFKPFEPGSFTVGWPGAIPAAGSAAQNVSTSATAAEATKAPEPETPKSREDELLSMRHFGLVAAAKKAGVDPTGKAKAAIVAEILAAEQSVAA